MKVGFSPRVLRAMRSGVAALVVVGLSGCSNVRVATDYEPSADFALLREWAWAVPEADEEGGAGIGDPLRDARIERATGEVLVEKGFAQVDRDDADFLVRHHVVIEKNLEVADVPAGFGYWGYWGGVYGTRTYVDQYKQQTLVIDVLEAGSGALLWRGSGLERVRDYPSPEAREKNIRKVVRAILDRFPPRGAISPPAPAAPTAATH